MKQALKTTSALQAAIQVTRLQEEAAAREFRALQLTATRYQERLEQLLNFQREYAEQFEAAGRNGIPARRLRDFSAFLASLDRSVNHLRQQLENALEQCQGKRQNWLRSRTKRMALEKVVDRHDREENDRKERREQAENEELYRRRPDNPASRK